MADLVVVAVRANTPHSDDNALVVRVVGAIEGVIPIEPAGSASLTNKNDSDSSLMLIDENTDRIGLILFNDSTAVLYLKYGTTASSTSFTYKIPSMGTFEMPMPIYTGRIDGIWDANTSGAARITEMMV